LDAVAEAEAARQREQAARERQELEEFKRAAAQLAAEAEAAAAAGSEPGSSGVTGSGRVQAAGPAPRPASLLSKLPVRTIIKPKPKGGGSADGGSAGSGVRKQPPDGEPGGAVDGGEPEPKKLKVAAVEDDAAGEGLTGLLGGYGSDSDEDDA
jgi:hypothetical protein